MHTRDHGILGDHLCPHCAAIFMPVHSRGHVGCFVCHAAPADGDECDRWHGYPAEPRVAHSERKRYERQAA